MKWFHRKRLERLADKLVGEGAYAKIGPVPAHKFDMQHLFVGIQGGEPIVRTDFNPIECNTAACALGWADSDSWFIRKGSLHDLPSEFWGLYPSHFQNLFMANSYDDGRWVEASVVAARLRKAARTS